MSSPVTRTALAGGGEPARPGQPAGERQAGDRPGAISPGGEDLRAGQVRCGLPQLVAQRAQLGFGGGEHAHGGGGLLLPGRRQVRGRGGPQTSQARPRCATHPQPAAGRPGGRTPRGCAAPRRCARGAGRGRSPAAPGTPGSAPAGSSIRAAGPRPAAPADAGRRSCRSWPAFCGRAAPRCRPAHPDARRSRPRPAPRRHTATRNTPPPRTRHPRSRRTGPARLARAPGQPGRSAHA